MPDPVALSALLLDDPAGNEQLAGVDPVAITGQHARVAFWLNVYNALLRAELAERPRAGSLLRHRRLFGTAAWQVGDHRLTLDEIEHGLLRGNARPPYRLRPLMRGADPRLAAAPPEADPRVHFALNCGARSCPLVRPYDAAGLDEALETATRDYLRRESDTQVRPGPAPGAVPALPGGLRRRPGAARAGRPAPRRGRARGSPALHALRLDLGLAGRRCANYAGSSASASVAR